MSNRRSAGIVLYRLRQGRIEVLLAHPGGPFFGRADAGNWSIPKGEPSPDEVDMEVTARREFEEETGHRVPRRAPGRSRHGEAEGRQGRLCLGCRRDLDPRGDEQHVLVRMAAILRPDEDLPEIDRVEWFAPEEAGAGSSRLRRLCWTGWRSPWRSRARRGAPGEPLNALATAHGPVTSHGCPLVLNHPAATLWLA